jgi:hypothetical protein
MRINEFQFRIENAKMATAPSDKQFIIKDRQMADWRWHWAVQRNFLITRYGNHPKESDHEFHLTNEIQS